MNDSIKKALLKGNLTLFLGAGASVGSSSNTFESLPLSTELASSMADACDQKFNGESLSVLYSALKSSHQNKVNKFFEESLRYCKPSYAYHVIARYSWRRIYTINIDDALDKALQTSKQRINITGIQSAYKSVDTTFQRLDLVKLHGAVDRLHEGIIFSPEEYADLCIQPHHWYEMLPQDYSESTFLYIGTKLNEPALLAVLRSHKRKFGSNFDTHFILTPSATEHEIKHLSSTYNVEHLSGDISSFATWLQDNILPEKTEPNVLFALAHPGIKDFSAFISNTSQRAGNSDFNIDYKFLKAVQCINFRFLETLPDIDRGAEQSFYHGMKATWSEIKHEVPAQTTNYDNFLSQLENIEETTRRFFVIVGPAGSGKTTLLMQAAKALGKESQFPVYYLNEPERLEYVVKVLNNVHPAGSILFLPRVTPFLFEIKSLFDNNEIQKCRLISAEKKNIWRKKCEGLVLTHAHVFEVEKITVGDAEKIIEKIHKFGRWTYLEPLPQSKRIDEFTNRSNKQLLIALLEATRGKGYHEIIEEDYLGLETEEEKALLILVGLFTLSDCGLRMIFAFNALSELFPSVDPQLVLQNLSGIVYERGGLLYARHPLYVDYLFKKVTSKRMLADCIVSLLHSFKHYEHPYRWSMPTKDYDAYKVILNNKFIRDRIRDKDLAIGVYSQLEKQLGDDGHFWLHYGLTLKYYEKFHDAYDKLKTSVAVYDHSYGRHACAVLELLLALKSDNSIEAENFFHSGKSTLLELDENPRFRYDLYPIVSLAEGAIKYADKLHGSAVAKEEARKYANLIQDRKKIITSQRLEDAWSIITSFWQSGAWQKKTFLDEY